VNIGTCGTGMGLLLAAATGIAIADEGVFKADAKGLSIASADGNFALQVRGLLQVDARLFVSDDVAGEEDEFLLRRARLSFDGRFGERLAFRLRPESSSGVTSWIDAYVDWTVADGLVLRAGKFKPPVGLERLQSASDLRLVERGFVTELVPSRDVGLELSGTQAALAWQVGIFNGVNDGRAADVDDDGQFELAARVFFEPIKAQGDTNTTLGFGVGATSGERSGSLGVPLLSGIRTPAQETAFRYRGGADGTFADGNRYRVSPQAYWYTGPFGVLAEYALMHHETRRADRSGEVNHEAWQVTAEWNLNGAPTAFRGAPAPGTWQLVAQVEALAIDEAAFAGGEASFANAAEAVSDAFSAGLGLNWFAVPGLKVSFVYRRTTFDGGAATGDRPDEQVILTRVQFSM
jgi:phosphate-selective porin OprO and OprP